MTGFSSSSKWMKSSLLLIAIGFIVWLSAANVIFLSYSALSTTHTACLVIGLSAYFLSAMLTYLYIYIDDVTGSKPVLIGALVTAFIASLCAIIALSLARVVTHSDRMAYSAACAIAAGVFAVQELRHDGGAS